MKIIKKFFENANIIVADIPWWSWWWAVNSVNWKTWDVVLTKSDISLSNADNTSDLNKPISTATQTALNNKADLVGWKVPSWQLPSYVDDVLEFSSLSAFPVTWESWKIYIDLDTWISYRWTGSIYTAVTDLSNYYTKFENNTLLNTKVDKVVWKQLSTEDYTTTEKNKLAWIEVGAEVNNISDINATDLTDGWDTSLHNHDNRYYTETEVNSLISNISHNNTTWKQGWATWEYFHLTNSEYLWLVTEDNNKTLTNKTINWDNNSISNIRESNISLSDNTTNNVSITKHWFVPKAPNNTWLFLSWDWTWRAPPSGWGWSALLDIIYCDNLISWRIKIQPVRAFISVSSTDFYIKERPIGSDIIVKIYKNWTEIVSQNITPTGWTLTNWYYIFNNTTAFSVVSTDILDYKITQVGSSFAWYDLIITSI